MRRTDIQALIKHFEEEVVRLRESEKELFEAERKLSRAREMEGRAAALANRAKWPRNGKFKIWNRDCISGMAELLPDNVIDMLMTSIPFEELFTYSGKAEDVGNNGSTVDILQGRFALNLRFVIEQIYRVMKPGRNVCIHIQQLLAYKNQHGYIGRRNFRDAVEYLFRSSGFNFAGEFVISKNPQAMAQRLNLHSLMFITGKRNSTMLAPAPNDYVMVFEKPGEPAVPVRALYDSKINPGGWVTTDEWVRDAHGIWTDINETDVLDGWRSARESDQEKHVCPLQLQVIERCILLYTNAGETVFDPFMGIGSTAYKALELGRNSCGFELKESYYNLALRNLAKARQEWARAKEPDLLTVMEAGGGGEGDDGGGEVIA